MTRDAEAAHDDPADAIELLALVATFEDHAFSRFAADAVDAPQAEQRLQLSRMAALAVDRRDRVLARLTELGGDAAAEVARFDRVLDDLDVRTQPHTFWERLLRGYVGFGVSDDFCRLAAWGLDPASRDLVLDVLDDEKHTALSVAALSDACEDDEALSSRLALWGRRVVGESLQIVSKLLTSRPGLARLSARGLLSSRESADEVPADAATVPPARATEPARVLNELTAEHSRRMSKLKLTA